MRTRHTANPDEVVRDEMKRFHTPLCSNPELITLVVESSNEAKPIWPTFSPSFSGPYHVSLGNQSSFSLYARSNFVNMNVTYTVDGENASVLLMGDANADIQVVDGSKEVE